MPEGMSWFMMLPSITHEFMMLPSISNCRNILHHQMKNPAQDRIPLGVLEIVTVATKLLWRQAGIPRRFETVLLVRLGNPIQCGHFPPWPLSISDTLGQFLGSPLTDDIWGSCGLSDVWYIGPSHAFPMQAALLRAWNLVQRRTTLFVYMWWNQSTVLSTFPVLISDQVT